MGISISKCGITGVNGISPPPNINLALYADNIAKINDFITQGPSIPEEFYRSTTGKDYLLEEQGLIHLHIGRNINDDILLIVKETENGVIFVAVTDHSLFDERPRGKTIKRILGTKIAQKELDLKKPVVSPTDDPPTTEALMRSLINLVERLFSP